MSLRRLQQRCQALLQDVRIPDPFDLETFCEGLAARRGRPLHLLPLPDGIGSEAPCGAWVATEREDWVFVEAGTSPLHREHIVLHELAHMICGHTGEASGATLPRLLPHLDVRAVKRVLARASYTNDEEREAELLASLILARARRIELSTTPEAEPELAAVLDRVARTLGTGT